MTDKEKIRKEVVGIINSINLFTPDEDGKNSSYEAGKLDAATKILQIIDSMQEEPIFKVGDTIQKKDNNSIRYSIINKTSEGYRALRGLSDTIVIWFSEQDQWKLVEEPVSEDLEEAANNAVITLVPSFGQKYSDGSYVNSHRGCFERQELLNLFKNGAKWQKNNLWKPADGDDLPIIDREVIALLNSGKVVFAHRPYKGKYIGKSLTTGNIETFENKTYGKGGWNIPDVKWWLDCGWPNEEE